MAGKYSRHLFTPTNIKPRWNSPDNTTAYGHQASPRAVDLNHRGCACAKESVHHVFESSEVNLHRGNVPNHQKRPMPSPLNKADPPVASAATP